MRNLGELKWRSRNKSHILTRFLNPGDLELVDVWYDIAVIRSEFLM